MFLALCCLVMSFDVLAQSRPATRKTVFSGELGVLLQIVGKNPCGEYFLGDMDENPNATIRFAFKIKKLNVDGNEMNFTSMVEIAKKYLVVITDDKRGIPFAKVTQAKSGLKKAEIRISSAERAKARCLPTPRWV